MRVQLAATVTRTQGSAIKARRLAFVAALFSTCSVHPALAQDAEAEETAEAAAANDGQNASDPREIIVTADRRAIAVQDIPQSITAFTEEMMRARGIDRAEDLMNFVPGLTFSSVNREQGSNASIRGIGLSNDTIGGDPGVTLYMDGHYLASPGFLLIDYLDVDRVEVQRGPQGTLYGRNSMGGNINIITARPTDELHVDLSAQVGNWDNRVLKGIISGPLAEGVRARFAISDGHQASYVRYDSGTDTPMDYTSMRGTLDIDVAPNFEIRTSAYRYRSHGFLWLSLVAPYPAILTADPTHQAGPAPATNDGRFTKQYGGSFDAIWSAGDYEIRSLTAYNNSDYAQDMSGLGQFGTGENWSQELQIVSPEDRPFRWIAGAYYFDEDTTFDFNFANATTQLRSGPHSANSKSIAGYLDGQYDISDSLEIFAGIRYTHDEKTINRRLLELISNGVVISAGGTEPERQAEWSQWTYRGGVNYHVNEDVMLYATYSRGYKAGGFNASSVNTPSYGPETVDAFEGGVKSQFLDDTVQLNVAGYYYDYGDKQEFVSVTLAAGANYITNAASAIIKGGEAELVVRPIPNLSLNGSVTYLHARYKDFRATDNLNPAAGIQDLEGNRLLHAPDWKITLGGQYIFELGNAGEVTLRADYAWIGDQDFSIFNTLPFRTPSYDQINANIRWVLPGDRWSVEAFAKNLGNDIPATNAFSLFGQVGYFYAPPRTYGARLRYNF